MARRGLFPTATPSALPPTVGSRAGPGRAEFLDSLSGSPTVAVDPDPERRSTCRGRRTGRLDECQTFQLHRTRARLDPTELYLVGEVQKVYKSQGVDIHDKHRADRPQMPRRPCRELRHDRASARPARRQVVLERERQGKEGEGRPGDVRAAHSGITKASLATSRSFGRFLPGDDEGAHRRVDRGKTTVCRSEGERDHRQADPAARG